MTRVRYLAVPVKCWTMPTAGANSRCNVFFNVGRDGFHHVVRFTDVWIVRLESRRSLSCIYGTCLSNRNAGDDGMFGSICRKLTIIRRKTGTGTPDNLQLLHMGDDLFNVFCPFGYERFKCNESCKLRLAVLIDFMTEDCSMETESFEDGPETAFQKDRVH